MSCCIILHHIIYTVLNTTVQAYKSIVNKTDPNVIDEPNSINNDIGTRPPVSVNNVRPSIGEIGDSQRGWSHDTNVATPSPVHEAARLTLHVILINFINN